MKNHSAPCDSASLECWWVWGIWIKATVINSGILWRSQMLSCASMCWLTLSVANKWLLLVWLETGTCRTIILHVTISSFCDYYFYYEYYFVYCIVLVLIVITCENNNSLLSMTLEIQSEAEFIVQLKCIRFVNRCCYALKVENLVISAEDQLLPFPFL